MQAQQAYVARSRKPEERDFAKTLVQPPPHKERALWNFLTWSFFLAQVLAAEQFIGAQAKAADDPVLKTPDSTGLAASPLQSLALPDGTVAAVDDVRSAFGGSLDDTLGPSVKLGYFGDSAIDLDYAALARSEDFSQSISAGGYGMAEAGSLLPGDTPIGPLPDTVVDVVVPDVLEVIGDVTGPLLDTVEDIVATLTGLVGGITDPLLHTVGGVAGAVDDVVHEVLAPVTNLVEDLAQPLGGALASAGQLTFPVLNLAGLDDLYNNGRYTDYSIELQTSIPASPTVTSSDPIGSAAGAVTDVVDHVVDAATRPLDDVGRHLAHVLDDLGSRDGLL